MTNNKPQRIIVAHRIDPDLPRYKGARPTTLLKFLDRLGDPSGEYAPFGKYHNDDSYMAAVNLRAPAVRLFRFDQQHEAVSWMNGETLICPLFTEDQYDEANLEVDLTVYSGKYVAFRAETNDESGRYCRTKTNFCAPLAECPDALETALYTNHYKFGYSLHTVAVINGKDTANKWLQYKLIK